MEALLLQDGAYVNDRYEELQEQRRQLEQNSVTKSVGESDGTDCSSTSELSDEERQHLEHWRIVQRAKALDTKGPTPQLTKKFIVLRDILDKLYAENETDLSITSPSNEASKRLETTDSNSPVQFKELPMPTQVVLKMFFRTCQSLLDPTKLTANCRLSVQIASKLPIILTTMPSCVLSPGLTDDVQVELEDGGNVWSVFYQLFQLFEELLGLKSDSSCGAVERVCLSVSDRATVIVAYVALSLKWGRLGYLLKGVKLLLENANELNGAKFEPLLPLFRELAATLAERPQVAFGEEVQPCGYLMSFGKGDHGKLGHGQCVHVSCQEGNCTENKMVPTMIGATRDVLFRKIDSLSTHSIAITAKGDAMAWGNGDKYRLGHGSSTKEYMPRTIEFLSLKGRVRDLACGLGHTLALMESGELFAWGNGSNGRLGLGDTNDRSSPSKVAIPTSPPGKEAEGTSESVGTSTPVRFRHIFCGASHSLGISWDGKAYAWGKNNQGQCGHGHTNDQLTIQEIESFRGNEDGEEEECVTYAAGGWEHTLFCSVSGRVYSCGCGYKDSRRAGIPPVLGHGDCDRRLKPTLVQVLDDAREEIVKVACGWDHSLAVSATGKVYTWGSGTNGKLGHGDEESFDIPTLVRSMDDGKRVKDAKAGCEHTVFLTHDHELWTCGQGDSGRLGHGDSQTRKRPTKIEIFAECGLKPVALAVGDKYNLVLVRDSDAQYEHEGENELAFIQKTPQRVGTRESGHVPSHGTANVCRFRHRTSQHKKRHDSLETQFGANWVLDVAAGEMAPTGSPTTKSSTTLNTPDSATSAALFIAGYVDRLASDYLSDKSEDDTGKRQDPTTEAHSKAQKSVLHPFAVDTSYESLQALLLLLRWTTSTADTKGKALPSAKGELDVAIGLCLGFQERMGLSLSCLRILQLNLKKALDVSHSPAQSERSDLFGHIHELLNSLAGLKEEDVIRLFDNQQSDAQNLAALGSAISHEAACALKMGFGMFYPTKTSRCSLLWEIFNDCKVSTPSMRTIILSDQLCKDSIMTEIFRCLPSRGLLSSQHELLGHESATGKDMFDIKTLMIVLLKRSSVEAIKHLDNEAFADVTNEPDCFLRLLHVLQMHYFSIAHRSTTRDGRTNGNPHIQSNANQQMMDSLLDYVDALMVESLVVLKKLHIGSRQHEEVITWRLNGSLFHTLLPSAIECLSVLLLPRSNEENAVKVSVARTPDNLLLVERILPNLHVMLKMLDEVSWKMHTATDAGNQTHDDNTEPSHQPGFTSQERNWFIDLGDACAVLCGKLTCELFYPSTMSRMMIDDSQHGEGRPQEDAYGTTNALLIRKILEWERLGVFEVEDELVGCKEDCSATGSALSTTSEVLEFLTKPVDVDVAQRSLGMKQVDEAILRTGICILHDLLRKLTTSSAKRCLLGEFVAVVCRTSRVSTSPVVWSQENDKPIGKAVENLFVRLARIISSEDASFGLKKKALMAWTVPLSTSRRGVLSVVDLIAKSGIMSTLVELLLDEANVLDTHGDINAVTQLMTVDNQEGNMSQNDSRLSTKVGPIKSLLFDQTPAQIISVLAWEAFCAIVMQLSTSKYFAEHKPNLLLRSAGSSLHEREPLTPRSISMSPRRRLTLPKKMVISSIDEIIEQMTDGLFLMLKGTKNRLDTLDISSREYDMLLRRVDEHIENKERFVQQYCSRIFLFGRPVQISHSSIHDIGIPKCHDTGDVSYSITSFTVSFWIYVEHTGAMATKESFRDNELSKSKETSVCLIEFSSGKDTSPTLETSDGSTNNSLVVFTREAYPDHVSIGLSMRCDGDGNEGWYSVLVDEHLPRGKWVQVVLGFDKEGPGYLQVFVGSRRSTLNTGQQSVDRCKILSLEFLQNATSWTQITTGGNVDMETLINAVKEPNNVEALRLSVLPKKPIHGFAAVLDDVIIANESLTEEMIIRMQINGPVLFRLKQQHIAESHCVKVLRLLCQLVGTGEGSSREVLLTSSDRWVTLLSRMLQSTCRDQDIAQVYLCYLLQDVLPRASSLPEFDVQALGRTLFGSRQMKSSNVEQLFATFNDRSRLPSTSTTRRQNEAVYRTMQQLGILHGKYRGDNSSDEASIDVKAKFSLRFAAAVHLFQKLLNSPSWKSRMDQFVEIPNAIFQNAGRLKEIIQSEEIITQELDDLTAVVIILAGYSEEVVNCHRASVQDATILPSAIQASNGPFDSVLYVNHSSVDQVKKVQSLIVGMLRGETRQTLCLQARKDLLDNCHDVVAANAVDQRISAMVHQHARVLRVLMTALIRENYTETSNPWHAFLLDNTAACDDLLQVASSSTKEYVTSMLGPDAKIAMKLRRLRIFTKEVLRGEKHCRAVPLVISIADLESLQWRLWEEMATRPPSVSLIPWWQQSSDTDGKFTLEVVGGDVELCDLKVKALEHFPTVRLAQANICANSGVWFFEVVVLTDGLMQIGYVDGDFAADPLQGQGVGDHTNSWAFDGFRCKKWNVNSYDYGEQWKADDVVGVLLDTDRMEISYFLNGKFLGVAFSGIPITASSWMCPAASLNVNQSAEFNFGTLTAASSSEEGLQFGGFKHLPVLDNEDQARLRPIMVARQTRLTSNADDTSNVDSPDKDESKANAEDWSSNGNDTDDGEIALEGSENLSVFRRYIELSSRDGRETHISDPNDEENGQRRRDLIEGLTGLGFPLEWATRCASEARLPMDETGAVAWILEQMEKVGLDGASRLPPTSSTDGSVFPDQHAALWSNRMQLPNQVVSDSSDNLAAEASALAVAGALNPLERLDGSEITQIGDLHDNQLSNIAAFHPPSSSLPNTTSIAMNAFIEADKDDQQGDDVCSEAFQSSSYRQRQTGLQLSESKKALDSKREVDDLLPLRIAVDTTVFVAYARQTFTSLLLLASKGERLEETYRMARRLVSSEDSASHLHRFLRIAIGLDTMDAAFELGYLSESVYSKRSLRLQQALAALLKYEAQNSAASTSERSPVLKSFSQEMLSQCDRGLTTVYGKQSVKGESMAIQAAAAWFAWVSGLVIGFVEDQVSGASSSDVTAETRLSDFAIPVFSSTVFVEKLVTIASSPSSTTKAWKYVAFKLITRILFVMKGDTSSEFCSSAQLANLTELFTLRRRRELYNRVFFSDVTSTLFALLVRSSASIARDSELGERQCSENQRGSLRVNNFSSSHVTITWDQDSPTILPSTSSDNLPDEATTEPTTEIDSASVFLHVTRCGPQLPACVSADTNAPKALPSKGTYTIRNLLHDTQYRIRLVPNQPLSDKTAGATDALSSDFCQGAEVIVQTPLEPVFELDRESMGKNLTVFSRNLTAKNTVNKKWHSIRASVAFEEGVHTWQVRLDTCVSKNIFIGVCTADASMENYIGSDAYGYGFLANKAVWHNKAKLHTYGEIFKQGDIIQVTLDCNAKTLAFSRNGEYFGIAASNIRAGVSRSGGGSDGNCKWYPAFSMYNKDDKVTLIPPPARTMFSTKEGHPQNSSTFELIEAMRDVLAYQSHLTSEDISLTKLFEKAFEEFERWRCGEMLFREISLGQVIAIDQSKSATDKYGLGSGDSVFTSKGQCTVLGEYRHELWYEVDEGGSSVLFGTCTPQLGSWSLSTCRDMLNSPDEYPVHRHHKYKLEQDNAIIESDSVVEQRNSPANTTEFSFKSFVDAQVRWSENGISAAEADAKLIAEVDAISSSQASSSPLLLSFPDITTALLLEKIYEVHGVTAEYESNQTMARIGLLLYVNRCLHKVVRLTLPRNIFATSLRTSESPDCVTNQPSAKQAPTGCNTECHQVSPVAALLNSPHWTLEDPSAFTRISTLATRLLFSSQKEQLIVEELHRTKTASRTLDSLQEPSDNEDINVDTDLPVIKISYPGVRAVPFWEYSSALLKTKRTFHLPLSAKSSVFVQLAKQLTAQDARQWRRESSQPFEAIPISQTFKIHVEKPSTELSEGADLENGQQQQDEDDEDQQQQQPTSKQTAKYLNIFENVVREIQSPCFPLFAPGSSRTEDESLQLDINIELFSPSALAHSPVQSSELLLWYFCVGQTLGIAWRSKLLLPLQFLSKSFWEELIIPADTDHGGVRETAIRAIRDGLFSIIPSRCVALLSGSNPSLQERLSDLDVSYVDRLERHATYIVPRQSHHDVFWKVVRAFTSVERRMLEQFVNPERRNGINLVEVIPDADNSASFVLEIAEALADGRDHPDSCYPVVVPISSHSSRLHLPAYSSAQTLRHKLLLAMTNIPYM